MAIANKKEFTLGFVLLIAFFVVLAILFSPIYNGMNYFQTSDNLFNSISKDSSNYLGDIRKKAETWKGKSFEVGTFNDKEEMARLAMLVLSKNGIEAEWNGKALMVKGDVGQLGLAAITDSETAYNNNGPALAAKYDLPGPVIAEATKEQLLSRQQKNLPTDVFSSPDDAEAKYVMYLWHRILTSAAKNLDLGGKSEDFPKAKFLRDVTTKAVELGFNYYSIQADPAKNHVGMLAFDLVFYVIYTLWFGYAIFFMSEGYGFKMKAGKKKEA